MSLTLIAVCRYDDGGLRGGGGGGEVSARCLLRRRLLLFDLLESSNKGWRMLEMSHLPPIAKLMKTDKFSHLERNCKHVSEIKKHGRHWGISLTAAPAVQWADKQESRNSTQPPETLVFISYQVETSLVSRPTAHGLNVCV